MHHVLSHGGTEANLLCDVATPKGWEAVDSHTMVHIVRLAANKLDLQKKGIDPDLIGAHSLQAGIKENYLVLCDCFFLIGMNF